MTRRRAALGLLGIVVLAVIGAIALDRATTPPPADRAPADRARRARADGKPAREAPRRATSQRPKPPAPAPVRPAEGGAPAATEAAVFGRVRGAERLDDGTVFLEGCGVEASEASAIDQDGGFYFPTAASRCRVRAWRRHGALRLPGEWVEIDASAGGEVDVELDVPTFAPAGMGIGFRPMSEGVVVEQVHPGTPAYEAGLLPGDVITAINGVPTDGMGMEDFLHEGIGPEGSEVTVVGVSADGEAFDTTFTRRPIVLQ